MGYLAGTAFVLSTATAATAFAQPGGAAEPGARRHAEARTVIVRSDEGDRDHSERRVIIRRGGEDPAEHLRTMLQLKPSQEAALSAYVTAVRPEHRHERMMALSDHGDARTTPQRLAEMEARLAEQAARGHARIAATRKFYDQLEPSQKKVFDELPMLMLGPTGPMMPMGPMKVMVNMERMPHVAFPPDRVQPPIPPRPPAPPHS
jgi:hypothetical protein